MKRGAASQERSFTLGASLRALPVARRAVDAALWHLGHDPVERAQIAVNELVVNAITHGDLRPSDAIVLHITATDATGRVEVKQATQAHAQPRVSRDPGHGVGLRIVSSLADDWGCDAGPPGVVWFEVRSAVA